jgi:hypothetical protein
MALMLQIERRTIVAQENRKACAVIMPSQACVRQLETGLKLFTFLIDFIYWCLYVRIARSTVAGDSSRLAC